MEHLLTGEQKLFDLQADFQERKNLIQSKPEEAARLKAEMSKYLKEIDSEQIQNVYQARFRELDRFEATARKVYANAIRRANGDRGLIEKAHQRLNDDLRRFERNRKECRKNMQGRSF